jgi:Predicted membrane protein
MKKHLILQGIAINSLIAALYVVLSLISGPLAFVGGSLQLRISEILNLLVFFNPSYTIGVTIGCLLTNILSLYGWPDIVIGTFATLLSCLLIILVSKTLKNLFFASFIPVIINASLVPVLIYLYDTSVAIMTFYWMSFMWVALGEIIVVVLFGYPLILILAKKYKGFYKLINATQNESFKF